MLKRLELIGFKSFADKTVLEFGPGITAIVGPNGSGKSNIVDAVRWILGEQSAKSLRGGEMTDVIFNGSPTRRSLGMAEVTLTLDNSRRLLPFDADEVAITRRVYRDGHGEYLINRQPARLRDIKELFLGSGLGGDAYCIIEQGKVDLFLAASPFERRAFFEEAAGITRFKAKKLEALRKLERVQENLTRLQDIQGEVERQLRSVRQQASKAQRYRELMDQLRDKRVQLSLLDCHFTYSQWQQAQLEGEQLRHELDTLSASIAGSEQTITQLEQELERQQQELHQAEEEVSRARSRIASARTAAEHESRTAQNFLQQMQQLAVDYAHGDRLLADAEQAYQQCCQERNRCQQEAEDCRNQVMKWHQALDQTAQALAQRRRQLQEDKNHLMELMRQAAHWANEVVSLEAQRRSLLAHRDRLHDRHTQTSQSLEQLDAESRTLERAELEMQNVLAAARQTCQEVRQRREETRQRLDQLIQEFARLKEQRSAFAAQAEMLQALETALEGVGAGVRQILQYTGRFASSDESRKMPEASFNDDPSATEVIGLVADLVTVSRDYAAMVELALGRTAEAILVRDLSAWEKFKSQLGTSLSGPVTFIPLLPEEEIARRRQALLQHLPVNYPRSTDGLPDHPDLLACAAQLLHAARPELASLPLQLLYHTLVVRDLTAAQQLRALLPGCRFVTLQGELLEADGSLTIRGQASNAGLLSRKSALRELQHQLAECDEQIAQVQLQIEEQRQQLQRLEQLDEEAQQELRVLTEQAADLRSRLHQYRQQQQSLREEIELGQLELTQLERELQELSQRQQLAQQEQVQTEQRLQAWHCHLEELEAGITQLLQQQQSEEQNLRDAQSALAAAEERSRAVERRWHQAARELEERRQTVHSVAQQCQALEERSRAAWLAALRAGQEWAEAAHHKEQAELRVAHCRRSISELTRQRQCQREQWQALREKFQTQQARLHQHELHQHDLERHIQELATRLREEHELDLLELYRQWQPPHPLPDRQVLESEVSDLKRRIARLGNVNLEALEELAQLEERACTLQTQLDDLLAARRSLDEILQRIEQESQQAFLATFESVRGHFQELFRKLFGGGQADIVLENPNQPLESGVEIVARPPGKELSSISLLSGGEKTLAAVALLLAIFRSKPSPFCILDEVDAALDEMNIGRFTAVLREFTDLSQFIVITHSKKTMTAVDALYGITMQESGVSKPVAVRFEDWPESEHTSATVTVLPSESAA